MKPWILLLLTPPVFGQTTYIDCHSAVSNHVQCTAIRQPVIATPTPEYKPQIAQPDIIGSYLVGQEAGLRAEMIRLQSQLLEAQLRQSQNAIGSQQAALVHQLLEQQLDDEKKLARQRKALEQTEACQRLNSARDMAQMCIDRLKVSDPEYALAVAEMSAGSGIWLDVIKNTPKPVPDNAKHP